MAFEFADLCTPRLRLMAITPDMLLSEQRNDQTLGALIGCSIPANWPPAAWEPHVLVLLLAQYQRRPEQVGWQRYIVSVEADGTGTLIGAVGAFWREELPNECEIGYSVLPPYEGRGLATEATRALLQYIRQDPLMRSTTAHTFPELVGSIRVLERCGFVADGDGEEARTIRYRLEL